MTAAMLDQPKNKSPVAYVVTNGCQTARADRDLLRDELSKAGYFITDKADSADLLVVSLCGFQGEAYNESKRLYEKVNGERKQNSKLIATGCAAGIYTDVIKKDMPKLDYLVPWTGLAGIIGDLNAQNLESKIPTSIFEEANYAEITVARSCASKCTFCAIPKGRGPLKSYPIELIASTIQEITRGIAVGKIDGFSNGIVEENSPTSVTLLGEDVGAYGRDIGSSLVKLLRTLYDLDGNHLMKINVLNPWWFTTSHQRDGVLSDIICDGVSQKRLVPYFGLPLQSGSSRILGRMKRHYTAEEFEQMALSLKRKIPELGLGTDVIVGFPGETEEDFKQTSDLLERLQFAYYGLWGYTDVPGTESSDFPEKISMEVIQERLEHLEALVARKVMVENGCASLRELRSRKIPLPIVTNDPHVGVEAVL